MSGRDEVVFLLLPVYVLVYPGTALQLTVTYLQLTDLQLTVRLYNMYRVRLIVHITDAVTDNRYT